MTFRFSPHPHPTARQRLDDCLVALALHAVHGIYRACRAFGVEP